MSDFAYLRVHTHFSGGGGPSSPDDWCRHASELGYKAIGVADRAHLASLPALALAARRYGLTPIFGMEVDLLPPAVQGPPVPVVLFAASDVGLWNLLKLGSLAYAGWPRSEQFLAWDDLCAHSDGLALVLLEMDMPTIEPSAGKAGEAIQPWIEEIVARFPGRAFVGLPHPAAASIGGQTAPPPPGLPVVALPAARFERSEHGLAYRALREARKVAGWQLDINTRYWSDPADFMLSPAEAAGLYSDKPDALRNLTSLVEMCAPAAEAIGSLFAADTRSPIVDLKPHLEQRLAQALGVAELPADMLERLASELKAGEQHGSGPSLRALAIIADAAKDRRIPLGAPLGSVGGSLIALALGLAEIGSPRPALERSEGSQVTSLPSSVAKGHKSEDQDPATWPLDFGLPGVEIPATRREEIFALLAREYGAGRAAYAGCSLPVSPTQALQAAGIALNVPGEQLEALAAEAREGGWERLAEESRSQSPAAQAASLALLLRGAPVSFVPDFSSVVFLGGPTHPSSDTKAAAPAIVHGASPWVAWAREDLCLLDCPVLWAQSSAALTTLDSALRFATEHPLPGLDVGEIDPSAFPEISEEVAALFKKGEIAGIPHLFADVLKGWKGDWSPESLATLVARSCSGGHPKAPEGIAAWAEHTQSTGGTLLYYDQFDRIIEATAGVSPNGAAALRRAMLDPETDTEGALKAWFLAGCVSSGIAEEDAGALWQALTSAAPTLISHDLASARARTAAWLAVLKVAHPTAFLAAALGTAWERGGTAALAPLIDEARRLGITLLAPDVAHSPDFGFWILDFGLSSPPPAESGFQASSAEDNESDAETSSNPKSKIQNPKSTALVWGLGLLPGWDAQTVQRFVEAREGSGGCASLRDLALLAVEAGLTPAQVELLVRSGACDAIGGRETLLRAIPEAIEWARQAGSDEQGGEAPAPPAEVAPDPALSPRERYLLRCWEEQHLGVGFIDASEMLALRRALDESGGLKSRLLATTQVGPEHLGRSIYLVGLLHEVTLHESGDRIQSSEITSQNSQEGPGPETRDKGLETRDSDRVATAWVEDLEGSIELVAFPPNYKRHQELWVENNLVIITGRVRTHADGEGLYLLCEHLARFHAGMEEEEINVSIQVKASKRAAPLADAAPRSALSPLPTPDVQSYNGGSRTPQTDSTQHAPAPAKASTQTQETRMPGEQPTYHLVITLPTSHDDQQGIDRMISLERLLKAYPGPDMVTLRIPYSRETGAVTSARLPWGVRYNSSLELDIGELLGPEALALIRLLS